MSMPDIPLRKRMLRAAERQFKAADKALWSSEWITGTLDQSFPPKRAWNAAREEVYTARTALEEARAAIRPKTTDSLGFHVYVTKSGHLIMLSVHDGVIRVYDDNISPTEIDKVSHFETDGVGDFNWGVVGTVLDNKLTKSPSYRRAKTINRNGL